MKRKHGRREKDIMMINPPVRVLGISGNCIPNCYAGAPWQNLIHLRKKQLAPRPVVNLREVTIRRDRQALLLHRPLPPTTTLSMQVVDAEVNSFGYVS